MVCDRGINIKGYKVTKIRRCNSRDQIPHNLLRAELSVYKHGNNLIRVSARVAEFKVLPRQTLKCCLFY